MIQRILRQSAHVQNPSCLGAILFTFPHLITACSVYAHEPLEDFAESAGRAVAQELVSASSNYLPDTSKPIHVELESSPDWLRNNVVRELIANQFTVASESSADHQLLVSANELGSNALHVSLALNNEQKIERIFRFERTNTLERPVNRLDPQAESIKLDDEPKPLATQVLEPTSTTSVETVTTASLLPIQTPEAETSALSGAATRTRCTDTVLQQGSLKQNLVQILQACGWRLGGWPVDPKKPTHELDWIVPSTQTLAFESLDDLLHALRVAFNLEIELDFVANTVRVQLRD